MYVVSKSEDHLLCNQCTVVREGQTLHNVHGISERDNISSRDPQHMTKKNFYLG